MGQWLLLLAKLVSCAASLYVAYWVYWEITVGKSRRQSIKQHVCKPVKQVRSLDPLLGLDLLFQFLRGLKQHKVLEQQQLLFTRLNGNTIAFKLLLQSLILTAEAENIKTILSLNFNSWGIGNSRRILIPLLGKGIFSSDGDDWRHSRDILRPIFVRSQLNDLSMLEYHVEHLIQAIPRDGSMVDLSKLFPRFTLDVATEVLFGESTDDLSPNSKGENAEFIAAFNRCQNLLGGNSDWGIFALILPNPGYKRDCKLIHKFVDQVVENAMSRRQTDSSSEEASAGKDSRYVLLQELISQTNDTVKIRSELLNILFAGRDTTASFLSNLWFELSKSPDVCATLRREVDSTFRNGERPESFEQLKNMRYLRAVLNESLRLYPIIPSNSRTALEDTVLPLGGGEDGQSPCFVPKGRVVGFDIYTMHRRKDLYGEDADVFKPERWLDSEDKKGLRPGWAYLPFNGGPRNCIGQQFALTETSYVTVRLMQEFASLESRDPEPWRELFTLTCSGLGGCKVALVPRD